MPSGNLEPESLGAMLLFAITRSARLPAHLMQHMRFRTHVTRVPRVVTYTPLPHAGVAEWQTRMVQVHVGATPWRFNSSHPHHL